MKACWPFGPTSAPAEWFSAELQRPLLAGKTSKQDIDHCLHTVSTVSLLWLPKNTIYIILYYTLLLCGFVLWTDLSCHKSREGIHSFINKYISSLFHLMQKRKQISVLKLLFLTAGSLPVVTALFGGTTETLWRTKEMNDLISSSHFIEETVNYKSYNVRKFSYMTYNSQQLWHHHLHRHLFQ